VFLEGVEAGRYAVRSFMDLAPQTLFTLLALAAAFGLIALNAFFVAAEFAIVKVRRTRLEELAGQGVRTAKSSLIIVDKLDEYLSATQLGITLASLALGWIGEEAFASLLVLAAPSVFAENHHHLISLTLSFFVVTMLHVVLGELVPKSMAIQDAEKVCLWIARPLAFFYRFSRPLIRAFTYLANFVLRRIGYHGYEEPPLTEQELKIVMKESREDGVISDSEAQIINRAFEFSDKRTGDIMVARERVKFLSLEAPLAENLNTVQAKMHTRFPLCRSDFDSVVGIVHMKDVWPKLAPAATNEVLERNARPAIFVDSSLRQDQLMKLFQSCRAHLAVVRDGRSGKNIGIVTMEDVLEGLVGEIRDEHGN
jgi:CBS domain containing-hemolysin-like protein